MAAAPGMMAMSPKPTMEQMKDFLQAGITMMESDATREILRQCPRLPGRRLIELQRAGWDPLGIDQDVGCQALDEITPSGETYRDVLQLKETFVFLAMRTYLRSLEDRRPAKLEQKRALPRETLMEFFDACNTKLELPETAAFLLEKFQATKEREKRGQFIANMQRDLLEVLGYERDHGCRMLERVQQDFPDDKELQMRMQGWFQKAQGTMMMLEQKVIAAQMQEEMESNPEMAKAREQVAEMTPKERGELIERMGKKVSVLQGLPVEARREHLSKLMDEDRLEYLKAQILAFSVMQQQAQRLQGGQQSCQGPQCPDGSAAPGRAGPVAAPSQQQMM